MQFGDDGSGDDFTNALDALVSAGTQVYDNVSAVNLNNALVKKGYAPLTPTQIAAYQTGVVPANTAALAASPLPGSTSGNYLLFGAIALGLIWIMKE